jgi:pimeloyl-ACP methyl ester carboxylesterase
MNRLLVFWCLIAVICISQSAIAQVSEKVVDIPTRTGVTQRFLYLMPENPKAAVILFPGGHGGLQISQNGSLRWGKDNFLVRTRQEFADRGLTVVVIDAPSDRQSQPFLGGFRQKAKHAEDIKAVIAWLRKQNNVPVWLVGTSRGTQSAAFIATQLGIKDGGPDGIVLTSTILSDDKSRPVPEMPIGSIAIPVLVVHHDQDGCKHCSYKDIPQLLKKLEGAPRKELITVTGGEDRGDPCESFAYHGFNGIEKAVVAKVAEWIVVK